MCFHDDDYKDTYETRVYIRNGRRYEQDRLLRRGMNWRRRYGLGGSYYPPRYYVRPPSGRFIRGAIMPGIRYSRHGGFPHGVVPGGFQRGVYQNEYTGAMVAGGYPRGVVPGGYATGNVYSGGYHMGGRAVVPAHTAMVSFRSFLFSSITLPSCLLSSTSLPFYYWLA